jgi:transcriptional regulator with XRE-family HTH domain
LTDTLQNAIILSAEIQIKGARMKQELGAIIRDARRARRLTLRRLADQVIKDDGTAISPQYLFDIEVHHRIPSLHVLRELARVLDLDFDPLLASAGAADAVVREYLQAHPSAEAAVIKLFRSAQRREFEDWEQLRLIIEKSKRASQR